MRVCLFTEGTYPFVRGGVSTWCHDLIAGLPEIDFVVYALVGNPGVTAEYALPSNLSQLVAVPLYGHQNLRDYNRIDLGSNTKHRSERALHDEFLPQFEVVLSQIVSGMEHASPVALADALGALYLYFRECDYDWTMRRREVWETALRFFRTEPWHARFMSALEAVELVRALYRYFIPLAIELPVADVSHTSASGLCGIGSIVAKRATGARTLLTEHGIYLRERVLELARSGVPISDRTIKKNFFSAIARATYATSDVISPVCSYNTRWETFYGVPRDRIEVVYNGVDEDRFADLGLSPARPTVAAVLRIDPLKDVPTMIASAAVVRQTIPDVHFKIWGPAPDPAYFATCKALVAELGLEDTVEFMGSTSDPAAAYADAHIVALSSISEGFPYTIIEAMMSAKPVVATDVGGIREAVDRYGYVVPPKNPQRFGNAIAALLADPDGTKRMGQAARAFALERFTQRAFLANYRAMYAGVPVPTPVFA
ncbi:MAG: GT4 family glycosyltransferase PelF [Vulcanimicrobiaceae bacterium]